MRHSCTRKTASSYVHQPENKPLLEKAILTAIRPHATGQRSSMRLRQGSKRCVIPKFGGTARHSSYIQHIPTQHLASGGPDATLMHAKDRILCLAASAGTSGCEKPRRQLTGSKQISQCGPSRNRSTMATAVMAANGTPWTRGGSCTPNTM